MMLADGGVAWLDIPLAKQSATAFRPTDGRPLARDRARMEQLYLRRQRRYAQAHVRIDATAGDRKWWNACSSGWVTDERTS
jgi:shikimate kinase